jgi:hypothetical protein
MSFTSPASNYCKCVSAEDWIYPDCVRQMVALSEDNPGVGVVGSYSIEGSSNNRLSQTSIAMEGVQ